MSPRRVPFIKPVDLKPDEIEIKSGNLLYQNDLLGRDKEISVLNQVVRNVKSPLVMSLDSPWGGGKTIFIQLWHQSLKDANMASLYLNAWESDYFDDPMLPLLVQIDQWLANTNSDTEKKKEWEMVKEVIPALIKETAITAVRNLGVAGIEVGEVMDSTKERISQESGQHLIDNYRKINESMDKFRESLQNALCCLPSHQYNLIIFIDELDRCNPHYAVKMLERIKHLFNIEGIVFVLAINKDQLAKSFKGVYGPDFDGEGYLKRFIDMDYQLKEPDLLKYIDYKISQSSIKEAIDAGPHDPKSLEGLAKTLKILVPRFDYQLRDVNQLFTRLNLILRLQPDTNQPFHVLIVCMLILRNENPELYSKYKDDPSLVNEVINILTGVKPTDDEFPEGSGTIAGFILDSLQGIDIQEIFYSAYQPWKKKSEDLNESKNSVHREIQRLYQIVENARFNDHYTNFRMLAFEQVELVGSINFPDRT